MPSHPSFLSYFTGLCVLMAGCGDTFELDPAELEGQLGRLDGPTLEFDPGAGVLPFPHDVLRPGARVQLPPACGETPAAAALRQNGLNQLDGFAAFQSQIRLSFSRAPDRNALQGRAALYDMSNGREVPLTAQPGTSLRFDADCAAATLVDDVTVIATGALAEATPHVLVVRNGLTAGGEAILPSATWGWSGKR